MAQIAATASPAHASDEMRVLGTRQPGPFARIRELWANRSLLVWFGRKFTEALYANTALGWVWIPLRPMVNIVPRALIFGGVLNAPSNGAPYLLFFLVGLGVWNMLDRGWYMGTRALQRSAKYLKRMYLPRLVPLVGSMAPGIVEFALYAAFAGLAVGYETAFAGGFPLDLGLHTLLLPAGAFLIVMIALVLSLWTSVYGARGRDARWTVRAILNVWMMLTPVIYPLSAVPEGFRTAAELNPATAPMEMVRKALFGAGDVTALGLAVSAGFIAVVGISGLMFFSRREGQAMDDL